MGPFYNTCSMSSKFQKIAIIGCAGAGKTTLAKQLGVSLHIPIFHLDHHYWKPGWIESEPETFKLIHQGFIEQSSWIIDGNQMLTMVDRLQAADVIIFLNMPTYVCLWRVVLRWLKNKWFNKTSGSQTLTWGLIRYVLRYNRVYRPLILQEIDHLENSKQKLFLMINTRLTREALHAKIGRFLT